VTELYGPGKDYISDYYEAPDQTEHGMVSLLSRRLWLYLLHREGISVADYEKPWGSLSTTLIHRIAKALCKSTFHVDGKQFLSPGLSFTLFMSLSFF
jgi:hypothetical protein